MDVMSIDCAFSELNTCGPLEIIEHINISLQLDSLERGGERGGRGEREREFLHG